MIEPLFHKYKTTYAILDKLTIVDVNSKSISLYLNLEMILNVLFSADNNNKMLAGMSEVQARIMLIANIFNLAQHYRWYFIKKGYDTNVYIYWNYGGEGCYYNREYIPNYRYKYDCKIYENPAFLYIIKAFRDIMPTLRGIAKYMNQIHIITSDKIESSVIPYMIGNHVNTDENIIITNDRYEYQYVVYGYKLLIPRQEDTIVITKDNALYELKNTYDCKNAMDLPIYYLPSVLSLLGSDRKNIKKTEKYGIGSIIKIFHTGIEECNLSYKGFPDEIHQYIPDILKERYQVNFLCTDVKKQFDKLSYVDIHNITEQIIDKFDDNTIEELNNRYFQEYPIIIKTNHKEQMYNDSIEERSIFDR